MQAAPSRAMRADINITPLIDIVLVLLIVFIIMVPSLAQVMEAVVPQEKEIKDAPPVPPLVLTLDAAGQLQLQRDPVDRRMLVNHLTPILLRQPIQFRKVVLRVHGNQTHAQVVGVMDLIREADARVRAESLRRHGTEGPELRILLGRLKEPQT